MSEAETRGGRPNQEGVRRPIPGGAPRERPNAPPALGQDAEDGRFSIVNLKGQKVCRFCGYTKTDHELRNGYCIEFDSDAARSLCHP